MQLPRELVRRLTMKYYRCNHGTFQQCTVTLGTVSDVVAFDI